MREHTKTKEKTSPRSFTLTEGEYARMREAAHDAGVTASALLRRWIGLYASTAQPPGHLSPWGGMPDRSPSAMKPGGTNKWRRLGKCNPLALNVHGVPCLLCWPNGAPTAMRDNTGNIVSWTLTEEIE